MHFTSANAFLRGDKVLKGIPWQEHTSNLSLPVERGLHRAFSTDSQTRERQAMLKL